MTRYLIFLLLVHTAWKITAQVGSTTTTVELTATATALEPTITTEKTTTTSTLEATIAAEEPTTATTTLETTTTTEEPTTTTTTLETRTTTEEPTSTTTTTLETTTTTEEPTTTTTTLETKTTTEEPTSTTTTTTLETTATTEEPTTTTTLETTTTTEEPTSTTTTTLETTTTKEEPTTTTTTTLETTATTEEPTATTTTLETTTTTEEPTTTTATLETTTTTEKPTTATTTTLETTTTTEEPTTTTTTLETTATTEEPTSTTTTTTLETTTTTEEPTTTTTTLETTTTTEEPTSTTTTTLETTATTEEPTTTTTLETTTTTEEPTTTTATLETTTTAEKPTTTTTTTLETATTTEEPTTATTTLETTATTEEPTTATTTLETTVEATVTTTTTAETTTTTTTTMETTTTDKPMKQIDVNQCETSFGCFRQPPDCVDNCQLLITYVVAKNMPGYIDVTMTTTAEWIALGHNGISLMNGATGVICYKYGNDVKVTSFRAMGRIRPKFKNSLVAGTKLLYKSYQSNKVFCSFRRKVVSPSGSELYMLDLSQNQHAVWAMGPLNDDNLPGKHTFSDASGQPIDIRFMMGVTNMPTTTKAPINVDDCGTSFGCIRMPENCVGANCPVLITYKNTRGMPGYVDITMQTNQQYIAFGHNTAPQMPDTLGVICLLRNNTVSVVSFQAPQRALPNLKENVAVGTTVLYSSYTSGRLYCSFRRKLTVSPENSNYMLDLSQNQYAIWAAAAVNNDIPTFHTTYVGASPNVIDIRFEPMGVTNMPTTTKAPINVDDCGTSFGCIRMPENCVGANCPVLITYKNTRGMPGYVDITMQTNQQYIAFGHNTAPQMPDTLGVICLLRNNTVSVVSFQAPQRALPNLKENVAVGTTVLYSSYTSGRLYCSFRRELAVAPENSNYTLDLSQNQYAIWAAAAVNNDIPTFHTTYVGASPNVIDIRFEPGVTGGDVIRLPQLYTLVLSVVIGVLYQFYYSN